MDSPPKPKSSPLFMYEINTQTFNKLKSHRQKKEILIILFYFIFSFLVADSPVEQMGLSFYIYNVLCHKYTTEGILDKHKNRIFLRHCNFNIFISWINFSII